MPETPEGTESETSYTVTLSWDNYEDLPQEVKEKWKSEISSDNGSWDEKGNWQEPVKGTPGEDGGLSYSYTLPGFSDVTVYKIESGQSIAYKYSFVGWQEKPILAFNKPVNKMKNKNTIKYRHSASAPIELTPGGATVPIYFDTTYIGNWKREELNFPNDPEGELAADYFLFIPAMNVEVDTEHNTGHYKKFDNSDWIYKSFKIDDSKAWKQNNNGKYCISGNDLEGISYMASASANDYIKRQKIEEKLTEEAIKRTKNETWDFSGLGISVDGNGNVVKDGKKLRVKIFRLVNELEPNDKTVHADCCWVNENGDIITQEYTVSFDADGGRPDPDNQKVKPKDKASKPNDPKKQGYEFLGWYEITPVSEYLSENPFDFNTEIERDVKLKAKWKKVDDNTLTNDPPQFIDPLSTPDPNPTLNPTPIPDDTVPLANIDIEDEDIILADEEAKEPVLPEVEEEIEDEESPLAEAVEEEEVPLASIPKTDGNVSPLSNGTIVLFITTVVFAMALAVYRLKNKAFYK